MWRTRAGLLAVGLLLVAVGCTAPDGSGGSGGSGADAPPTRSATTAAPTVAPPVTTLPPRPTAAPWSERPVVRLRYDLAPGLARVSGRENVVFTPDRRTCEIVFRLWANKPETVRHGNALTLETVRVDGEPASATFEARGAPRSVQGSLARVPLPDCLRAGQSVEVDVDFRLTLATGTPERLGRDQDLAWWASAFPMLAWERGRGWATNPVVRQRGEMTTGEQFRLARLDVVVPDSFEVLGTGRPLGRRAGPRPGTAVESFDASAVRDVAVTAGRLDVVERDVDGVALHVGGPADGTAMSLDAWADESARALRELTAYLGPFPYPDLWVSVIPDCPSGIELPGAIQYADLPAGSSFMELVVSHETAHMWFYGLVGNNQGLHPWLDESFASFAQTVVDGTTAPPRVPVAAVRGEVGRPMSWWARPAVRALYAPGVYVQGTRMLLEARAAVGAPRFDALLRAYVADNAHPVTTPADVRQAFRSAPRALEVLEDYGALR